MLRTKNTWFLTFARLGFRKVRGGRARSPSCSRGGNRFEILEDRSMLAVSPIGSFLRLDGAANAGAYALALSDVDGPNADQQDVLAFASATALDSDPGISGFAHSEGTALIVAPTLTNIATPSVSASQFLELNIDGAGGSGEVSSDEPNSFAIANFEYVPDTNYVGNLWFLGHLYINATGGSVANDIAEILENVGGDASIGNASLVFGGLAMHPDTPPEIIDFTVTSTNIPVNNNQPISQMTLSRNTTARDFISISGPLLLAAPSSFMHRRLGRWKL